MAYFRCLSRTATRRAPKIRFIFHRRSLHPDIDLDGVEVVHHSDVSVRGGDLEHPPSESGDSASPDLAPMFIPEAPLPRERSLRSGGR
jgi:hypothetical protein